MTFENSKHVIRCGAYAVGYFDLCGQSNALRKYVDINLGQEDKPAIQRDFGQIARELHYFRSDIEKYFEGAREEKLADMAPSGVSPEFLAMAEEVDSLKICLQGFSDTVVAYVPIATSPGNAAIFGIGQLLISVASTMLMAFARGSVVRGAVDVSWAMEPFEGEIYGPALLSTYELECNANWPRVVIGPGIQRLWTAFSKHKVTTPFDAMNITVAEMQSRLAFEDTDGQTAVDYLGETMRSFIESDELDLSSFIDAAHVQIDSMLAQYIDDAKVQSKLQATLRYFESRVGSLNEERRQRAATFIQAQHPPRT